MRTLVVVSVVLMVLDQPYVLVGIAKVAICAICMLTGYGRRRQRQQASVYSWEIALILHPGRRRSTAIRAAGISRCRKWNRCLDVSLGDVRIERLGKENEITFLDIRKEKVNIKQEKNNVTSYRRQSDISKSRNGNEIRQHDYSYVEGCSNMSEYTLKISLVTFS